MRNVLSFSLLLFYLTKIHSASFSCPLLLLVLVLAVQNSVLAVLWLGEIQGHSPDFIKKTTGRVFGVS